jgi:hypothetical protein
MVMSLAPVFAKPGVIATVRGLMPESAESYAKLREPAPRNHVDWHWDRHIGKAQSWREKLKRLWGRRRARMISRSSSASAIQKADAKLA